MIDTTSFSWMQTAELVADIEATVLEEKPRIEHYIHRPHGDRFIKTKSAFKTAGTAHKRFVGNPDLSINPEGFKATLDWFRHRLFHRVPIPCSADVILCRSNISLFYFKNGFRIKIGLTDDRRRNASFRNEHAIRRQLETMNILNIPRLLRTQVNHTPSFFVEEIINGSVQTWQSVEAPKTFRRMIPQLCRYYQAIGIKWRTPEQLGIDIEHWISDYQRLIGDKQYLIFPFEIDRIKTFLGKKAPCSRIHGDFAIHNIIITQTADYLTDWELTAFDLIMKEFYKLLIIKNWDIGPLIHDLMLSDIMAGKGIPPDQDCLSFSEQLYFVLFTEVVRWLNDPLYPDRLLKRAAKEMCSFFKRARENPHPAYNCFA